MTIAIEPRKADVDSVAAIIRRRYRFSDVFTQNDLRPLIGAEGMQVSEHGMGAIWQHLKKRGLVVRTGDYVASSNAKSRGDVVACWRRVRPEAL